MSVLVRVCWCAGERERLSRRGKRQIPCFQAVRMQMPALSLWPESVSTRNAHSDPVCIWITVPADAERAHRSSRLIWPAAVSINQSELLRL